MKPGSSSTYASNAKPRPTRPKEAPEEEAKDAPASGQRTWANEEMMRTSESASNLRSPGSALQEILGHSQTEGIEDGPVPLMKGRACPPKEFPEQHGNACYAAP